MIDDDTFFAWIDGELDGPEAARVAAIVADDPALSARADQHRAFGARLKAAFDPIAEVPRPSATVIDFGAAKAQRRSGLSARRDWAALAATLVVGLVTTGVFVERGGVAWPEPTLASGSIAALDTQLASAPAGDVRIGLTFRNKGGTICRSYSLKASSGLACRDDGAWHVRGTFADTSGEGNYRMAAGPDQRLVELIDKERATEPFDAVQEAAAKARSWR
jgi:hypothetical protein